MQMVYLGLFSFVFSLILFFPPFIFAFCFFPLEFRSDMHSGESGMRVTKTVIFLISQAMIYNHVCCLSILELHVYLYDSEKVTWFLVD